MRRVGNSAFPQLGSIACPLTDRAHRCARVGDVGSWRGLLEVLERDWFAPLVAALRAGELASITLLTGRRAAHRCTRRSVRRWWRRR